MWACDESGPLCPPSCSNIYLQVKSISNLVWKYQRYHFIMAYHEKPVLPPPFILLCHLFSLFYCMCRKRKKESTYGPSKPAPPPPPAQQGQEVGESSLPVTAPQRFYATA